VRLLLLLLLIPGFAAGQEKLSIPSLDGKLELPGYWFGAVASEPRPAVISLHGCGGLLDDKGGLSRNRYRVAEYFNVERMHTLLVDSFTPRGLKSVCETRLNLRSVDYDDRREDVYAAVRWLAQRPDVDRGRIAVVGYSNGGGTVLSVLDRTDKLVQAQPIRPRAAVAFYPPCTRFNQTWNYEIAAPLLLMIGALDDWTPPHHCEWLQGKVRRAQKDARFELILFPGSHHGFDGYGALQVRSGLPTKSGTATVGANPEARDKALRRMFEFLSESMELPLSLSHEARFNGHRYAVPAQSGFARADDVAAVPLSEKGRARYAHYLRLGAPKAFAITEKGGWYLRSDDAEAMQVVLQRCAEAGVRCWLYAVDDRVVWNRERAQRTALAGLRRSAPLTRAHGGARGVPELN
jgi:dienelactone hydrolase